MRRWSKLSPESRETFWRSLHAMNATRIVIAVVLLLYLVFDRQDYTTGYFLYAETCVFYLAISCVFAVLAVYVRKRFLVHVVIQIAVDIAVISTLYLTAGGARSGLVILYLFPLGGAAILAPLILSLFSASLVALFLLAETMYQVFMGDRSTPLTQAGLYGAVFFALVLVVSRLAAKLIGQEELAARRGMDLSVQQAINQLIIADVEDGILVVGGDGEVFTCNPAALFMLGLTGGASTFRLADIGALEPVAQAFTSWLAQPLGDDGKLPQRAAFVTVKPHHPSPGKHQHSAWTGRRDLSAHLKLRFTRVDTPHAGATRFVIFMQDVTAIENQAQELKLASMGRLTASIAHEVRNPLSAIGHATALLAEDLDDKAHVRLLKIVGDNVARVNRMVEDILQLSRKVQPNGEPLYLGSFLAELTTEFQETHGMRDDIVFVGNTGEDPVRFDQLHLREVLVNLLTNAIRYASGAPASIRIYALGGVAGRMELHVQDDGPGITPDVRAHLFEPFYTTSNKGTGLGLYLARELCLNNDATLDYEYRFDAADGGAHKASGRFVITFAQPVAL
jgi:two-component system, NtrC family, sensor histidine kinase PilS